AAVLMAWYWPALFDERWRMVRHLIFFASGNRNERRPHTYRELPGPSWPSGFMKILGRSKKPGERFIHAVGTVPISRDVQVRPGNSLARKSHCDDLRGLQSMRLGRCPGHLAGIKRA